MQKKHFLPLAEIFSSISGETGGPVKMGERCVFLRISGCNLKCDWCDTPDTQDAASGEITHVNDIIDTVSNILLEQGIRSLVITGGEPLLYKEGIHEVIVGVIETVGDLNIQIETNGTQCMPSGWRHEGVSLIADYKPPSAGKDACKCYREELFRSLIKDDVVKIVVMDLLDLMAAVRFIELDLINPETYIALSVNNEKMAKMCLASLNNRIKRPNTGINCQIHKFLKLA